MPNPLALVPHAVGQSDQHESFLATVTYPLPHAHTSELNVFLDWTPNTNLTIEPGSWTMLHGHVLPQAGDVALIFTDDQRYSRCLWWGPSALGSPPPITIARAYVSASAATSIGWNQVPIDESDINAGNNFVGILSAQGQYLTPHQGVYRCSGQVELAVTTSTEVYVSIFRNGSEASRGDRRTVSSGSVGLVVSDLVGCIKGDLLDIRVFTSASATYTNCIGPDDGGSQSGVSNNFAVEFVSTL